MASPTAWTSSDGMLFTPADLPFFGDFTVASTSSRRIRYLSLLIGGGTSSTLGSPVVVCIYNSEQYSVHHFRMSCSSVRHFPALYWMVVVLLCFEPVSSFTAGSLSSCCFSAGFLRCLDIVLQSMSNLLFSCLFNLLVGFSIKFCTFSCILLLLQFTALVCYLARVY